MFYILFQTITLWTIYKMNWWKLGGNSTCTVQNHQNRKIWKSKWNLNSTICRGRKLLWISVLCHSFLYIFFLYHFYTLLVILWYFFWVSIFFSLLFSFRPCFSPFISPHTFSFPFLPFADCKILQWEPFWIVYIMFLRLIFFCLYKDFLYWLV